eukprot:2698056-Rhodomonas_salina.1
MGVRVGLRVGVDAGACGSRAGGGDSVPRQEGAAGAGWGGGQEEGAGQGRDGAGEHGVGQGPGPARGARRSREANPGQRSAALLCAPPRADLIFLARMSASRTYVMVSVTGTGLLCTHAWPAPRMADDMPDAASRPRGAADGVGGGVVDGAGREVEA